MWKECPGARLPSKVEPWIAWCSTRWATLCWRRVSLRRTRLPRKVASVYVGSEVCQRIYSFTGLKPEYYGKFGEEDIAWALGKNYSDFASGLLSVRGQLGDYANAKIIGTRYTSQLAKEHPDLFILTVSPGAIGGKDGNGTGFSNKGDVTYDVYDAECSLDFQVAAGDA